MLNRQALTHAWRGLRRRPSFAALVVLTLAIGIGATTAMFSIVDTLLIRSLPFPGADRLVEVVARNPTEPRGSSRFNTAAIRELRSHTAIFTAVEGYQFGAGTITGGGEPIIVASPQVSAGLLSMLGVTPVRGRLFTADDAGAVVRTAILSERFWRARYGADADVIGRELVMDGVSHTIVGVLPSRFRFPEARVEVWRAMPANAQPLAMRGGSGSMQTVASLRPGVSRAEADERLLALSAAFRDARYVTGARILSTGELLQKTAIERYRSALYLMFGAVTLVLIVACVNVTNLLLARASLREGEFAMLAALGASRAGVAGQMAADGVVLGAAGGAGGAGLAKGLLTAMLAILPPQMTYLAGVTAAMDWRVLGFAVALSMVTCVGISLIPAWRASRVDLVSVINRRAAGIAGGRDERWQAVLVVAQLATVVVLLAGAGLLATSFIRLITVDPGFDPHNLSVFDLQFSTPRYAESPGSTLTFVADLDRFVDSQGPSPVVTYSEGAPPVGGTLQFDPIELEGRGLHEPDGEFWVYSRVAADYLDVLRIPIVDGRTFTADEPLPVMLINEVMARRFWGGASPVGRRIRLNAKAPWTTVVGVTRDVKSMGPDDRRGGGMEMYFPFAKDARPGFLNVIVRSPAGGPDVVELLRTRIREIDPDLPVTMLTMDERFAESVWQPRFFTRLTIAFALVAVALASIGIYATSTYWVARRRRELAVRMALGASRRQVMTLIVGRGMAMAAVGAIAGLGFGLLGARTVQAMLFETSATAPGPLAAAALLLGALVLAGCFVPARRAGRLDPMSVLRSE